MTFERNPDPLRKKIEIDPVAEDRLNGFIENFKKRATEVITTDKHSNEKVKQILIGTLDLLSSSVILASIVDNRYGIYGNKTIEQQFTIWMEINFINRELGELKDDAFQDKERVSEGTMISFLIDHLNALLPRSG